MNREIYANRRELAEDLSDQLDMNFDDMLVFVDLTAQGIDIYIPYDISGVSDAYLEGHEVVYFDKIDSHDAFKVMEHFASSRTEELAEPLFRALSRAHPFKGFRYALEDTNQLEAWYEFKNKAYVDLAEDSLEFEGVDVVDGKIICTKKDSISIYHAHCEKEDE